MSSYIFFGLSEFAFRAAIQLAKAGHNVVAVDESESIIQKIADSISHAVVANALDFEVMDELGVREFDVAVIGLARHLDVTVLLVSHLQNIGLKEIIAQVNSEAAAEAIKKVGATEAVFPEAESAKRLANYLLYPGLLERFEISDDSAIVEVTVPSVFVGKDLKNLDIRRKYHVHVIGIKRMSAKDKKTRTIVGPSADTEFEEGDTMLVGGKTASVNTFAREMEEKQAPKGS
ncbi:MAG: TrkA family potassium uptake protein [Candidatus Brocadiia bacterium]